MQLAKVICSEAGVTEHVGKTRAARAGGADTDTYPEYDDMDYRMQNILNPETGHCVAWRFQHTDPNDGRPLARIAQWAPTEANPAQDGSEGNELDTCETLGFLDNHDIDDCSYGPGGSDCGFSSGCTGTAGNSDFYCDFYGNSCPNPDYDYCAVQTGYENNVNNRGMTSSYRPLGPVGPESSGYVLLPGNYNGGSRAYCLAQINSTVNDGRFDTVEQVHNQNITVSSGAPYGGVITPLGPSGKSRWWAVGPVGGNAASHFQFRASSVNEATADDPNNLVLKMELISNYLSSVDNSTRGIVAQPTCVPDYDCGADSICGNEDDPDTLKLRFRWRLEQDTTNGTYGSYFGYNIVVPGDASWPDDGVEGLDFTTWTDNDGSAWDSEAYNWVLGSSLTGTRNTDWVEYTTETGYSDDSSTTIPLTEALSDYKDCIRPVLLQLVAFKYSYISGGYTNFFFDDVQFCVEHDKDVSVP